MSKNNLITIAGSGGFVGAALVADLRAKGNTRIRAIDIKPSDHWYQKFDDVENHVLDLSLLENCRVAANGAQTIYTTSLRIWAAWASSRTTRPSA